ncbi:MAG: hypothetical protein PHD36_07630 [Desulfotomaculaceae bacterium]|nr:hypothetical protein [Desulfotomaculaceae bacterium]
MSQCQISDENQKLIKIVAEQNNISHEEVIETALKLFFNMYFLRHDTFPEREIVERQFQTQELDPEEIKKKINDDKSMVDTAIAEAKRLGLI